MNENLSTISLDTSSSNILEKRCDLWYSRDSALVHYYQQCRRCFYEKNFYQWFGCGNDVAIN